MRSLLAAVVVSLFLLTGCASLGSGGNDAAARIGVQYATLKVIDGDHEKASAVVDATDQAIAFASGDVVDLDVLEAQVRAVIPWDSMDLADRQLVELLILQVRAELEGRVSEGLVEADRVAAAVEVLQWVNDAAALAAAQ